MRWTHGHSNMNNFQAAAKFQERAQDKQRKNRRLTDIHVKIYLKTCKMFLFNFVTSLKKQTNNKHDIETT